MSKARTVKMPEGTVVNEALVAGTVIAAPTDRYGFPLYHNSLVDTRSRFYKNCKRQRKVGAKICQVCPFRAGIEQQEEKPDEG